MPIETRHLCDFSIDFEPIQYIPTGIGVRANYVVKEGVVTGERFNGELVAGVGDWVVVGTDQIARLSVRATIRADDGELVFVTNTGRIDLRDGVGERLLAGERLGPNDLPHLQRRPLSLEQQRTHDRCQLARSLCCAHEGS